MTKVQNVLRQLRPERMLPIATWLPRYERANLRPDVIAGVTIAAMLVPQAMAYSELAGLPPVVGLYTVTFPLFVYAVLGTSRETAYGPTATVSIMIAAGVGSLAGGDPARYAALAAVLGIIVGIICLAAGIARLGFVTDFLSKPVLSGYTSGAALVIGASQLSSLFGIDTSGENFFGNVWEIVSRLDETHLLTLGIGVSAILLQLSLRRWPWVPVALVAVVLTTASVAIFNLDDRSVAVVGPIQAGLPAPKLPDISVSDIQDLVPVALGVALVAYVETIAIARSFATRKGYEIDPNQELVALGGANIASGLFQGFPISGSFSRTSVNESAGARSQLAGAITGLLVIVTVVALMPAFELLPKSVLAAVVLVAVSGLVDIAELRRLYRIRRLDFFLALTAFAGTLVLGVLNGILIGVGASLIAVMARVSRPKSAVLGRLRGRDAYANIDREASAETIPGLIIYRFEAPLFFANAGRFRDHVRELLSAARSPVEAVLLDAEGISDLDTSAADMLKELRAELADQGAGLWLARVHGRTMDMLRRSGLDVAIGDDRIFPSVHAGAIAFTERESRRAEGGGDAAHSKARQGPGERGGES